MSERLFPLSVYAASALSLPETQRETYLEGVTIDSFVRFDTDFLVTIKSSPYLTRDENGDVEYRVTTASFGVQFGDASKIEDIMWVGDRLTDMLERWQRDKTSLSFATSSNAWCILAENDEYFLPFPA